MATQAQIEANRRNAQKSTGPRSTQGKLTAGQNALRHGLCAGFSLLQDETDEEVQALLQALRDEHQPAGATEEILVYKMAHHFFAQKRAESLMIQHLEPNFDGESNTRELSLLMRYLATADRGFNKCLADLRKLQKERQTSIPSRDREGADSVETAGPDQIGFVSQDSIENDDPPADPYAKVEKRRESDRAWAKFFPRREAAPAA